MIYHTTVRLIVLCTLYGLVKCFDTYRCMDYDLHLKIFDHNVFSCGCLDKHNQTMVTFVIGSRHHDKHLCKNKKNHCLKMILEKYMEQYLRVIMSK